MKNFDYVAPRTESDVLGYLSSDPAKTAVLAGGTDLMVLLKKMIATPDLVVNIMEVPDWKTMQLQDDGSLLIGATVTLDQVLEHPYTENYPAIRQAVQGINSMQFQSQGTIGGEICQRPQCWFFRNGMDLLEENSPHVQLGDNRYHAIFGNGGAAKFVSASRIGPALIALGASVRVVGPQPEQAAWMPAEDFFRIPRHSGQREVVLEPNQVMSHILVPPADGILNATYEVRHGEGPEYPLAAAAAALQLSGNTVRQARIVMGHVAPIPWLSTDAANILIGRRVDHALAEQAGAAAVAAATPLSENGYKVQLAKVAVKRAILRAANLETGGF